MRDALLDRLYSGFRRSPDAIPAFSLTHPGGVQWAVGDDGLLVTTPSGTLLADLPLSGGMVGDLVPVLESHGVHVAGLSPAVSAAPARVLLKGHGEADVPIMAHTSVLYAIFDGYDVALTQAQHGVSEALKQALLFTASDDWLNLWGQYLGSSRRSGQSDEAYLAGIIANITRKKSSVNGIRKAVKDATGAGIDVFEPWTKIFRVGASRLSGDHHLFDGQYYTHHVIQPVGTLGAVDWAAVMPVIDATKPAGVLVKQPKILIPAYQASVRAGDHAIESAREDNLFADFYRASSPLGKMRLDGWSTATLNHRITSYSLTSMSNVNYLIVDQVVTAGVRNVAKAAVVLSAGARLGDKNAILSRGQRAVVFAPDPVLSSTLALSGYGATENIRRVTEVTDQVHTGALYFSGSGGSFAIVDSRSFFTSFTEHLLWSGAWDDRTWANMKFAHMAMLDFEIGASPPSFHRGILPLGGAVLSGQNTIIMNHQSGMHALMSLSATAVTTVAQDISNVSTNIAKAAVVLSSGAALGDKNAILSRGQRAVSFEPRPSLSGSLALSDYAALVDARLVVEVTDSVYGSVLSFDGAADLVGFALSEWS